MVLQKRLSQVGELHCLNCGRVLGDLVRDLDGGSLARSYSIPLIAGDNPSQSHSP